MALRVVSCVAAAVVAVAAVVGSVYGLWWVFLAANPHFTLADIRVNTTGRLVPEQVIENLADHGIEPGVTNLWQIDLGAARRHLEKHVLVDRTTVVRRLPGELVVNVYERQPVARLRSRPNRLIDMDGYILPPRHGDSRTVLPEITGVRGLREAATGQKTSDKKLLGALRFLQLTATRPDGHYYDVDTIQLDYSAGSLTVHLHPRGTFIRGARVVLPIENMESALDSLTAIVAGRTLNGKVTTFVDATYRVNVPVKPLE